MKGFFFLFDLRRRQLRVTQRWDAISKMIDVLYWVSCGEVIAWRLLGIMSRYQQEKLLEREQEFLVSNFLPRFAQFVNMDAARLLRISPATRSVFSASTTLRPRVLCSCASRRSLSASSAVLISTEHLPRVAQPSLWQSLIPKPFRRDPNAPIVPKSKEWNPATIFIVLGLLVGSQAIQLIVLRKELANFIRQADAKIALLREVIERVQRGEKIDVDGLLGTGNAEKEKEWEEGKEAFSRGFSTHSNTRQLQS